MVRGGRTPRGRGARAARSYSCARPEDYPTRVGLPGPVGCDTMAVADAIARFWSGGREMAGTEVLRSGPVLREGHGADVIVSCICGQELVIDLAGWKVDLPGGIVFTCPCGEELSVP